MLSRSKNSKANGSREAKLWLFVREGEKDTYWPLHTFAKPSAGTLIGGMHELQPPDESELADIISFSPTEDLEMRAQKRESTPALTKRLMAEAGVRLIAWRQTLNIASSQGTHSSGLLGEISQLTNRISSIFSSLGGPAKTDESQAIYQQDRSRGLNGSDWLYATAEDRMKTTSPNSRLWPGRAMLRSLLAQAWAEQNQPTSPYVTGVVFTGEHHTLVIFFKASESGELETMVSANLTNSVHGTPEEQAVANQLRLEQALQNYLQHVRLAALNSASEFPADRICLFNGVDFIKLIANSQSNAIVRPYPTEVEYFGVGISTWWKLSTRVTAAGLIGVVCTSVYAGITAQWTKSESATQTTELRFANEQLQSATLARWGSLTKEGSVSITKAVQLAQSLHQEGLRLEIDADRELIRLKVIAKVIDASNTPIALTELMSANAPQGCARRNPETNTQLSELYITYECTSVDHGISSLLSGSR